MKFDILVTVTEKKKFTIDTKTAREAELFAKIAFDNGFLKMDNPDDTTKTFKAVNLEEKSEYLVYTEICTGVGDFWYRDVVKACSEKEAEEEVVSWRSIPSIWDVEARIDPDGEVYEYIDKKPQKLVGALADDMRIKFVEYRKNTGKDAKLV